MIDSSISEFKIKNKWEYASLIDIDLQSQTYELQLHNTNTIYTYKNKSLTFIENSLPQNLGDNNKTFQEGEKIEFYNGTSWQNGEIKNHKGKFYTVTYLSPSNNLDCKIVYINSLRKVTSFDKTKTLHLDQCQCITINEQLLTHVNNTENMVKCIRKVFTENEIEFIFYTNGKLYLFNSKIENGLIDEMISISIEHFNEIEKLENNFKEKNNFTSNNKEQNKPFKYIKVLKMDKNIYEMQQPKIKSLDVIIEGKANSHQQTITLTIKSNNMEEFIKAYNILNVIQSDFRINIPFNDLFFKENKNFNDKNNISYYIQLYNIISWSCAKYSGNTTEIKVIANEENIFFLKKTLELYCNNRSIKDKKLSEIHSIQQEILNLS